VVASSLKVLFSRQFVPKVKFLHYKSLYYFYAQMFKVSLQSPKFK